MPLSVLDASVEVGKAVAKLTAKNWMDIRRDERERASELIDLVSLSVRDKIKARRLSRQLEDIADQVAERFQAFYDAELPGRFPPGEREAALLAVADCLNKTDLSDAALLAVDMDPAKLARKIREAVPASQATVGLGSTGKEFFARVLDDSCIQIVQIIRQLPAFESRVSIELLQRMADMSNDLAAILVRLPKTPLGSSEYLARELDFRREYLQFISNEFDNLEIFGIDTSRFKPRTSVSAAYVTLSVTLEGIDIWQIGQRTSTNSAVPRTNNSQQSLSAEAALALSQKTFISGDAGSGKTTTLHWVAINAARSSFVGALTPWNGKVPFYVKLRSYANRPLPEPRELVTHTISALAGYLPTSWVEQLLREGEAILLVDGVDEVPVTQREAVRTWLTGYLSGPNRPIVLVTTRPSAVDSYWLKGLGFTTAVLEPMSPGDIQHFCHRWYFAIAEAARHRAMDLPCRPDELDQYEASMVRQLETRRHLRALATSPLLCAMLCALNLDRRTILPNDRLKLYEDAVELLIDRRDIERPSSESLSFPGLSGTTKVLILQALAWRFMLANHSEMSKDRVRDLISHDIERIPAAQGHDARRLTEYLLLRSGIIREPSADRVDFVHRSFQEYLAAREAAANHYIDYLSAHASSDYWHETIIMAAGLASAPYQEELVRGLAGRAATGVSGSRKLLLLAAACLETASRISTDTTQKVENLLDPLFPPRKSSEARALALGSTKALARLPRTLEGLNAATATACVEAATYMNVDGSLDLLAEYAQDPRHAVQRKLLKMWRFFDLGEYARAVLRDAPLIEGHIELDSSQFAPHLKHLQRLTSVTFQISEPASEFDFLEDLPALTGLGIITKGEPLSLARIVQHRRLQYLSIAGEGATDVAAIANLPNSLTTLSLSAPRADAVLQFIHALPHLKHLRLWDCTKTRTLRNLERLCELQSITLANAHYLRHIDEIAQHEALQQVALQDAPLAGGLRALGDVLYKLHVLSLQGVRTIRTLHLLEGSCLEEFRLWDCDVSNIDSLRHVKTLKKVSLVGLRLDDISPLLDLPLLGRLELMASCSTINGAPFVQKGRKLTLIVGSAQVVHGVPDRGSVVQVVKV